MTISELGSLLNVLIGTTIVSLIVAVVASIRKIKAGNIVDDDAVIARLDSDNKEVRKERDDVKVELAKLVVLYEAERRARWRAEDIAARYKRQLEDGQITPAPVSEPYREPNSERP